MKFELGNGKVLTGLAALRAYCLIFLMVMVGIAILVGFFFLRSYRWGNCS